MTEFEVYLWTRLDLFHSDGFILCCMLLGVLGCSALAFFAKAKWDDYSNVQNLPDCISAIKKNVLLWLAVMFLASLTPTSRDYALIKVLPKLANSDFAKEVPADMKDVYRMAKDYLKEKLDTPNLEA